MISTSASAWMSAPGDQAGRVLFNRDDAGRLAVVLDHQRLDVEHDVSHVFQNAGNRRELVLRAADFDLRDRAPLQARQQHPPQAVADRRAEATLERLGCEFAVGTAERVRIDVDDAGKLKTAPANMHCVSP
jgi:hypothetical protein